MSEKNTAIGANLPAWPDVDHRIFGEVEEQLVSKVQQLVGAFLHRNWLGIPHVTHNDDVDITDVEGFRKGLSPKPSILPFLMKAMVEAMREYPQFNASLSKDQSRLICKRYFNIGFAADTPNGLLVPVVKNVDGKSIAELSAEILDKSQRAREKGLPMSEMSGGGITVSALGSIGGTSFTPIINAPEVAILGATKAVWKPTRGEGGEIEWRYMLPLSLSYDHRVINGADAARFLSYLGKIIADPKYYNNWS
ncbi:dihydrolipoamide acetyltransferase [Spongiibacter sp. KMU-166]|uniref:Dihydrolipoamide acetyltransferase n=1 Tax=Spongiibacter thalassae TaxID=2721624 RepID=A0ABX1GA13_9GAMM|nr:2-oxo acid dehydrogenase subunit E2 [Spongiibacter thalassae]NKI15988.1 dihydrolipoamide acetyltransferase [Spongiibacter thalassae]